MDKSASPGNQAFTRFWRHSSVRLAVVSLVAVTLIGIYAPYFASEIAFAWSDQHGTSFPFFSDLFNRTSYPKRHDLLFNVISVLLPLLVAGGWLLRKRLNVGQSIVGAVAVILAVWLLMMVPMIHGRAGWDYRPLSACTSINAFKLHGTPEAPTAYFAPIPHRCDAAYADVSLMPPGALNPVTGAHFWLGTDTIGRDVFANLFFGVRVSLTIGLVATGISLLIGIIIGGASGYFGGWIDTALQRIVEIMMCFPTFILILSVVSMIGPDIFVIMLVIGLTSWAGTARLVRGEFLAQAVSDYVSAAESIGVPRWRIMFRHILPNTMAPIIITATFGIAGAVLSESSLSFLGLGDPTTASWGMLLEQGRENIHYPWLIYAPGLSIFLLVICLNLVGNGLRDAFDPKST